MRSTSLRIWVGVHCCGNGTSEPESIALKCVNSSKRLPSRIHGKTLHLRRKKTISIHVHVGSV